MIIIDRFEGNYAVLETDNGIMNVDRSCIPCEAREGDVLYQVREGYCIDREATQARRAAMVSRFNRLRRDSND